MGPNPLEDDQAKELAWTTYKPCSQCLPPLDPEAAAALRSSMDTVNWNKGQVLFNEGERGERLHTSSLDGKMKLGHTSSDGRESLLAVLGPGELLGELSLFDPGPAHRYGHGTFTETSLMGLGHNALRPWLTGRPEVAEALLQGACLATSPDQRTNG